MHDLRVALQRFAVEHILLDVLLELLLRVVVVLAAAAQPDPGRLRRRGRRLAEVGRRLEQLRVALLLLEEGGGDCAGARGGTSA